MSERPLFVVHLRPAPDVQSPELAIRAALKRLLRDHGLRCVVLRQLPETEPPEPEGANLETQ
jgi:hypothetical protein